MDNILEMIEHLNKQHDIKVRLYLETVQRDLVDFIEWRLEWTSKDNDGLIDEGQTKFFDKFAMGTVEDAIMDALDDFESDVHDWEDEQRKPPKWGRPDWDIPESEYH